MSSSTATSCLDVRNNISHTHRSTCPPRPPCLPPVTSQPTPTITAWLSLCALTAIIGSLTLVWLMHYKSSSGLAYPLTALPDSHLHVAATCSVHAERLRKSAVDTHRLLASWLKNKGALAETERERRVLSQDTLSLGRITETLQVRLCLDRYISVFLNRAPVIILESI